MEKEYQPWAVAVLYGQEGNRRFSIARAMHYKILIQVYAPMGSNA